MFFVNRLIEDKKKIDSRCRCLVIVSCFEHSESPYLQIGHMTYFIYQPRTNFSQFGTAALKPTN